MSKDTAQEKTEQPTPKRLRESREKGQVARSREFNTMALLMASAGGMLLMGGGMIADLRDAMARGLSFKFQLDMNGATLVSTLFDSIADSLLVVAPIFGVLLVVAMLTPMGVGGWAFSAKGFSFKAEKLNPIKGLGRIFAWRGLMELLKVLAKFALVAAVSAAIIWSLLDDLIALHGEPLQAAMSHIAQLCGWTFLACSSVLMVVAAIDVPFQLWQHNKQLRMTRQEVKDEAKETDGRPEVKMRIRAIQQEMSRRRMMEKVPDADVVITNPTHFAVALKYDQFDMQAPVVVAKGADLIAAQIRSVAEEHDVAIVEAPPLARALYASTELDQEIPAGLYIAVATVLSYVYQLKAAVYTSEQPQMPQDLPIPEEFTDLIPTDDDNDDR